MTRKIFVVVAVLGVSGISIFGQLKPATKDVEAAIRQQHVALAAAFNKRDAAAASKFFTPDADEVFFDGPRLVGANAIRENLQKAFSTWPASQRFTVGVTNIRMLTPDVTLTRA